MTDRPTPEQVGDDMTEDQNARFLIGLFLKALVDNGYVIVHPDDVPLDVEQGSGSLYANAYGLGWNNCHRRIFAATEETP